MIFFWSRYDATTISNFLLTEEHTREDLCSWFVDCNVVQVGFFLRFFFNSFFFHSKKKDHWCLVCLATSVQKAAAQGHRACVCKLDWIFAYRLIFLCTGFLETCSTQEHFNTEGETFRVAVQNELRHGH